MRRVVQRSAIGSSRESSFPIQSAEWDSSRSEARSPHISRPWYRSWENDDRGVGIAIIRSRLESLEEIPTRRGVLRFFEMEWTELFSPFGALARWKWRGRLVTGEIRVDLRANYEAEAFQSRALPPVEDQLRGPNLVPEIAMYPVGQVVVGRYAQK